MSFIKNAFDGLTGEAASDAAKAQSKAADKAIEFQRESRDLSRGDLQQFREAGAGQINPLIDLITNPGKQRDYVMNNPFFSALAEKAQSNLFANQAARGKVGSGGTAEALQKSVLLLGQDLLNQNIAQRSNLVTMGQNAAAGQATMTQGYGSSIADLITQKGNAQAAGIVGAANAAAGTLKGIGQNAFAISDERLKEDIERIGTTDGGFPVYRYRFKGHPETHIGVMAQDVENIDPEAVSEIDGVKRVNYERIH